MGDRWTGNLRWDRRNFVPVMVLVLLIVGYQALPRLLPGPPPEALERDSH